MRAPFQILAIPYRVIDGEVQYCVLHRADHDQWQFIAGGGEDDEITLLDCARDHPGGFHPVDRIMRPVRRHRDSLGHRALCLQVSDARVRPAAELLDKLGRQQILPRDDGKPRESEDGNDGKSPNLLHIILLLWEYAIIFPTENQSPAGTPPP